MSWTPAWKEQWGCQPFTPWCALMVEEKKRSNQANPNIIWGPARNDEQSPHSHFPFAPAVELHSHPGEGGGHWVRADHAEVADRNCGPKLPVEAAIPKPVWTPAVRVCRGMWSSWAETQPYESQTMVLRQERVEFHLWGRDPARNGRVQES